MTRSFTLPYGCPLSLYQMAETDPALGSAPSALAIPCMGRNLSISKIPQLLLNLQFMVTTAQSEMNPLEGFILETMVHRSSENSGGIVWQTHNDHRPGSHYCHRENPFTPHSDGCFCESQSERIVPEKCHALEGRAPGWRPKHSVHALEVRSTVSCKFINGASLHVSLTYCRHRPVAQSLPDSTSNHLCRWPVLGFHLSHLLSPQKLMS